MSSLQIIPPFLFLLAAVFSTLALFCGISGDLSRSKQRLAVQEELTAAYEKQIAAQTRLTNAYEDDLAAQKRLILALQGIHEESGTVELIYPTDPPKPAKSPLDQFPATTSETVATEPFAVLATPTLGFEDNVPRTYTFSKGAEVTEGEHGEVIVTIPAKPNPKEED